MDRDMKLQTPSDLKLHVGKTGVSQVMAKALADAAPGLVDLTAPQGDALNTSLSSLPAEPAPAPIPAPRPLKEIDPGYIPRCARRAGMAFAAWAAHHAGVAYSPIVGSAAAAERHKVENLEGLVKFTVDFRNYCDCLGLDFTSMAEASIQRYFSEAGVPEAGGRAAVPESAYDAMSRRYQEAYDKALPDHPGVEWIGYTRALEDMAEVLHRGLVTPPAAPAADAALDAWFYSLSAAERGNVENPNCVVSFLADFRHYSDTLGIDFGTVVQKATDQVAFDEMSRRCQAVYHKAGSVHPGPEWIGYGWALDDLAAHIKQGPKRVELAQQGAFSSWEEAGAALKAWAGKDPVLYGSGGPVNKPCVVATTLDALSGEGMGYHAVRRDAMDRPLASEIFRVQPKK